MALDYAISGNAVCQVTLFGTLFGQTVMNVFHYRLDLAGGTVAAGGAFLQDFNDALNAGGGFYETYVNSLPAQVLNIRADLQWIDPDRFIKRTFVVNPTGGFTHIPTTANLAAVIELRANIASRRSVGTKHLPGLGGTGVANGLVTAALMAQIEEFGDQAILDVTVGLRTMRPIIFGRARPAYTKPDGTVMPALPKSYKEVSGYVTHDTARVMRRRTVGLGI